MNLGMVKTVGSVIVSIGVGAVVNNAIKATTPTAIGKLNKFVIGVGALVLTSMVSSAAEEHFEKGVDEVATILRKPNTNENVVDAEIIER